MNINKTLTTCTIDKENDGSGGSVVTSGGAYSTLREEMTNNLRYKLFVSNKRHDQQFWEKTTQLQQELGRKQLSPKG